MEPVILATWAEWQLNRVLTRHGKEPSLLELGSVRVLPNARVRSVESVKSNLKHSFVCV